MKFPPNRERTFIPNEDLASAAAQRDAAEADANRRAGKPGVGDSVGNSRRPDEGGQLEAGGANEGGQDEGGHNFS
jgi:hypothetical protein